MKDPPLTPLHEACDDIARFTYTTSALWILLPCSRASGFKREDRGSSTPPPPLPESIALRSSLPGEGEHSVRFFRFRWTALGWRLLRRSAPR